MENTELRQEIEAAVAQLEKEESAQEQKPVEKPGEEPKEPAENKPAEVQPKETLENKAPENNEQQPAENKPAEEGNPIEPKQDEPLPNGLPKTFEESWKKFTAEDQKEISRVFSAKDGYITRLEGDKKERDETLSDIKGFLKYVAKQGNTSENNVIKNWGMIAQDLSVNPDMTLSNMIGTGYLNLHNPDGFIRNLLKIYKIDINQLAQVDQDKATLYDNNKRLEAIQQAQENIRAYQAESQYSNEEDVISQALENFFTANPDYSKTNKEVEQIMSGAINAEKTSNPTGNYEDWINGAWAKIKALYIKQEAPTQPKAIDKEALEKAKKASISLKSSSPANISSSPKKEVWNSTREQSESLRSIITDAIEQNK